MDLSGWRVVCSMDVGQKRDWTTGGVFGFPVAEPADGTIWQTTILGLHKLRSRMVRRKPDVPLLDIVEVMCRELFDHFPTAEAYVTDATRDTAVANWMGRRYGDSLVEAFIFSDPMHMEAWHSMLYYINDPRGYPWPDPTPGTVLASHVAEFQEQMTVEEVRINDRGKFSFRHPGPHNDWLHMGEMAHYKIRQMQNATVLASPMVAGAVGAPPWTQDPTLRPPFLAALDARAGRSWGRPRP